MTRTFTDQPVWTWKCDQCGSESELARTQTRLPSPDAMREQGWYIAPLWGDLCPMCVAKRDGQEPLKKPRRVPAVHIATSRQRVLSVGLVTVMACGAGWGSPIENVPDLEGATCKRCIAIVRASRRTK